MINKRYILYTRIPIQKDASGRLFCDPLWAKDIKLHLNYISNFSLCCPVVNVSSNYKLKGQEEITDYNIRQIYPLTKDEGLLSIIRNFFPNFIKVAEACSDGEIVHSGGAGWAFPLSFYLLILRPFLTFHWVIVIESSFWMLRKDEKITVRRFVEHHLYTILLKLCVKYSDARIFTQTFYKNYFLNDGERTLIAPATWVDEDHIIASETLFQKIALRKNKPLEILFPARLEVNKGVYIVFDAIKILSGLVNKPINITFMGKGVLAKECEEFSKGNYGSISVKFHEPVEYGKPFFDQLFKYDVVLVPNLAEEQPRIIFDAFSQGIAVIASDTTGIIDITENNKNIILFERGDSQSLADSLFYIIENPDKMDQLGLEALDSVKNKTHKQMHVDREFFLKNTLK